MKKKSKYLQASFDAESFTLSLSDDSDSLIEQDETDSAFLFAEMDGLPFKTPSIDSKIFFIPFNGFMYALSEIVLRVIIQKTPGF